jgi:hypothetical protein
VQREAGEASARYGVAEPRGLVWVFVIAEGCFALYKDEDVRTKKLEGAL